jgi:hypothetical protein
MVLSKSEFCQFSLNARNRLVEEYGQLLVKRGFVQKKISVYKIYGFYVEAVYNTVNDQIVKIEPIYSEPLLNYYIRDS